MRLVPMNRKLSKSILKMRRPRLGVGHNAMVVALNVAILFAAMARASAADLSNWSHRQSIEVAKAGLVRVALAPETFDASEASLADLRLVDAFTNEVPFLIERPRTIFRTVRAGQDARVSLENGRTRIELDVKIRGRLAAFTFETPAPQFLKAVAVNGTTATGETRPLVANQPVFRQPGGASQLTVKLPDGSWSRLTILLDDGQSRPIPVTGLLLHEEDAAATPPETATARIVERVETPGETRLTVDLGAAHLPLAGVRFETSEPLFTRKVSVMARVWEGNEIHERVLGSGVIFRISVNGQSNGVQLEFPLDAQTTARELILVIDNGDSPPLPVTGVTFLHWPVRLVFQAREPAAFLLLSGSRRATAPRYDLASLSTQIKDLSGSQLTTGPVSPNPNFHPSEPLPEIPLFGAVIDVSPWRFRRPLQLSSPGIQQLELSPHVLAHARPDLADVRVVASGRQVPYLLDRASLTRALTPEFSKNDDPSQPRVSRWQIKLPQAGLPIAKIACEIKTALFQRAAHIYELAPDDRGQRYRRDLGNASWVREPERRSEQFTVALQGRPVTDTLILEIDNGDNPALDVSRVQVFYSASKLFFKAPPGEKLEFCYGNSRASSPNYDLALVAGEMVAVLKSDATFSGPEPAASQNRVIGGSGSMLFWGVLGLVVVGLLVIISRLLPRSSGT